MSSPTVIRHAARKGEIFQVVSYFDKSGANTGRMLSAFQVYNIYSTGKLVLTVDQVYLTEQGAIAEWQSVVGGLVV